MSENKYWSVTQLNQTIRTLLEGSALLNPTWVEGEISNCKWHSSGHIYFTLKDDQSAIRCVMFRGRSQYLKFRPDNGMKVLVSGSISVYEREGQYQLYANQMEPQGIGALAIAFAQLKERLNREGLFALERKRKLPFCPKCIGIVTSPTGAAVRDMVSVLTRRFPQVRIILAPVLVQGIEAPAQIVAGIELLNRLDEVEVIIVGRGGGSIEELWAFNEEIVARGIAASSKPVVSAVGHETDFTISDMVADLRAPTPSAAAELVVPDVEGLVLRLADQQLRLDNALQGSLRRWQDRLAHAEAMLDPRYLLNWVMQHRRNATELQRRLHDGPKRMISEQRQQLRELMRALNVLSPLQTLDRGYAIVRRLPDGSLLTSVERLLMGDEISVRLADGEIESRVLGVVTTGRKETDE